MLRSFVPLTGNVAWCPNPKCTRALRYRATEMTDVTCQCGMRFCVSCDAQAHSPATCEEFTQWQHDREGLEDLLSQQLLMQEYKKCPKCGVHLQRWEVIFGVRGRDYLLFAQTDLLPSSPAQDSRVQPHDLVRWMLIDPWCPYSPVSTSRNFSAFAAAAEHSGATCARAL